MRVPSRTPLILSVLEQASVPVDWPKRVGEPPGITKKIAYPAGNMGKFDDEYPCTTGGKKFAQSHKWLFPSKRIKVCGKISKD